MDTFALINLIMGVVSITLAIVSIIFSALFYLWSKEENERTVALYSSISESVKCLEKLFDKMYSSTYDIVRENNRAMQNQLFPGKFSDNLIQSKDFEVYSVIFESRQPKVKISDIADKVQMTSADVFYCLQGMQSRGIIEIDGESVRICPKKTYESEMSSSE
ncbi:MAG: hypothetical protein IKB85_01500 [Bacteroidales bacterium]|nr:hypothetical protein [Bacteroidales bacterium]